MSHQAGRFASPRFVSQDPRWQADNRHMPAQNDPIERPEGLETRPESMPLVQPDDSDRPDWLVGADPGLDGPRGVLEPTPPSVDKLQKARGPLRVVEGGKPAAAKGWSGAASSVPKLTVVPTAPPPQSVVENEQAAVEASSLGSDLPADLPADPGPVRAEPVFRPLQEPWYLIWGEALVTQRRVQLLALLVAVAIGGLFFWSQGGTSG